MYITKHFRMVSHARDPTDISWKQLISTINTGLKGKYITQIKRPITQKRFKEHNKEQQGE